MKNSIEEKVLEILKKYSNKNQIESNTKIEELNIDSLKMIQSIVNFEESFEIEFEVEKLSKAEFIVIKDLVQYIQIKVKDKKMYKMIHKTYYDCFEDCLCTILYNHNRNIEYIYCNSWDVCVWNKKIKEIFTTEPDMTNLNYLLKKYYGIKLNKFVVNTNDELSQFLQTYYSTNSELIVGVDMYQLPWSEYYKKIHSIHYIILLKKLDGNTYLCADPTQNVIDELEINNIDNILYFILLEGIENETECKVYDAELFKEQQKRLLKAKESNSYPLLFTFAENFLSNYSDIFDANEVPEDIGFIRYLLYMSRVRLAYSFFLEQNSLYTDYTIVSKLKNLSTMWANLRLSIMKSFIKKDWDLTTKKHQEELKKIVQIEFNLYEEYIKWCEKEEKNCSIKKQVDDDRNLKEIQLELLNYYNSSGFWVKEKNNNPSGFDQCGYYYKRNDDKITHCYEFDNISCSGQRILLKHEIPLVGIRLCGSSECGNYGGKIILSEKEQDNIYFNFTDWREKDSLFNEEIKEIYECCDYNGKIGYGNCNIYTKDFMWKKPILVKSLQLPDCSNIHIFSIRLFKI